MGTVVRCVVCGDRAVELVELPVFGRPTVLMWHKRRRRCTAGQYTAGTVTEQDPQIAAARARLTTRAGRWVTFAAGRGPPHEEIASGLGVCWHVVNASVQRWGQALLEADTDRVDGVSALGLEEVLMARRGRFSHKAWSTRIVDVGAGKLLDIVPHRTTDAPHGGYSPNPRTGAETSIGRPLICQAHTAARSTRRCPIPNKALTRSMWSTREPSAQRSTQTSPEPDGSDTAAANQTRCTGHTSCCCQLPNTSATIAADCWVCSTRVPLTARSVTPATQKRHYAASMTSTTPTCPQRST